MLSVAERAAIVAGRIVPNFCLAVIRQPEDKLLPGDYCCWLRHSKALVSAGGLLT